MDSCIPKEEEGIKDVLIGAVAIFLFTIVYKIL
jgi:hypothetical protein